MVRFFAMLFGMVFSLSCVAGSLYVLMQGERHFFGWFLGAGVAIALITLLGGLDGDGKSQARCEDDEDEDDTGNSES